MPACGRPGPARRPAAAWSGTRVLLAAGQPRRRGVGHGMHRPIAALIGPQAGHGDDAVVDLAHRAEVLAGHMRGGGAVLAVAGVVDDQHARIMGGGGRVLAQQLHPPVVDRSWSQADSDRNHCSRWTSRCWAPMIGSAPASPVSVLLRSRGSSRPLQVVTEAAALGQAREQGVELLGVVLQAGRARAGTDGGRSSVALAPGGGQTMDRTAEAYPNLNKLPLGSRSPGRCGRAPAAARGPSSAPPCSARGRQRHARGHGGHRFSAEKNGLVPAAWSVTSASPTSSGTRASRSGSMPCRMVTSARLQP